ncbi:outer membrane protein assembly factor BamA [Arenibacterium halophilum]|uniref:Outer membrane protein assembly factor BamA n=1 Tax=Arenibacterium halophilum TaxID=2583821 RepID=A0ABY2XBP0_9RHOB|nr:outer membrane protein assembly factor BamA [Arenibacterium halophilum]TMV13478.1 outer membrane protein assembly factor BamA [Arenibacterium halophilum]
MALGNAAGKSCVNRRGIAKIWYKITPAAAVAAALIAGGVAHEAWAQSYRFNRISVEGNQRIQTGTIANYAGLDNSRPVSAGELNDAYQRIVNSGLFESVELVPSGSTLVVRVVEYPTINRINFEGNRRIKDEALGDFIESQSRRVFSPGQAEADAATIAEAYAQQGRIAAKVTPRIIRRSDNRVDLVFEISEGDTIEIERVSFVGNRAFSDRRLRRVLETKQANFLRTFIRADTLIEERIQFDRQVLRDFYLSRGYIDFRTLGTNAELTRERDAFFLVVNVEEGQQFRFGQISTTSEIAEADAAEFQEALKIKPGVVYTPTLVENAIARMERLAIKKGIDFLRVEPRITRNDRELTLDVELVLTRGPRIFVERIDVEGNTTTLDRVVRQQFRIVEGDPFNPREIRESAERIRALGYFENADVEARQGSTQDQVVIDVDVEEKPTGSLSFGGSYSLNDGFGVAVGLRENNFLGRGQRLSFTVATAQDSEEYTLGFTEPYLLGRNVQFDLDLGVSSTNSSFASYDTNTRFFVPKLTFPVSESGSLQVSYNYSSSLMEARDNVTTGNVVASEIAMGRRASSAFGLKYSYDSRLTGLNPNAGVLLELGADFGGLGGDNKFVRARAKAIAQKQVLREEVTLRATFEAGALRWRGNNMSRSVDRFILNPDSIRGFEPAGIGPRDLSNGKSDALGGNTYAVARFEAEFPLGLPEELGIRGGLFYDVGNLWGLENSNSGVGTIVGESGSLRHVIGFSILWDTGFGPLRLNFSNALRKETYDKEQTFDLTLQARF